MREKVIEELKAFHKQLTEITDDDMENDNCHLCRSLQESYELFDCAGSWLRKTIVTMFIQVKSTKKVFIFNSAFVEEKNAERFERLMKELDYVLCDLQRR